MKTWIWCILLLVVAYVCFSLGAHFGVRIASPPAKPDFEKNMEEMLATLSSAHDAPTWLKKHELAIKTEYDALCRFDERTNWQTHESSDFLKREIARLQSVIGKRQKLPTQLRPADTPAALRQVNDELVANAMGSTTPEMREQWLAFLVIESSLADEDETFGTRERVAYAQDEVAMADRQLEWMKQHQVQ